MRFLYVSFDILNVLISWKGNTESTQYSYYIDNASLAITTYTSVTFHDLDEGKHTFRLEPQNEYYTGEKIERTFTVDAVLKPGMYFSPKVIPKFPFQLNRWM